MFKFLPPLTTALAVSAIVLAAPARAESFSAADQFVTDLMQRKLILQSDKVWLATQTSNRSAQDLAACDAISGALAAQGVAVMWDVGLVSTPATGSFQDQLTALKNLGASKLMALGPIDDMGSMTVRIVEVPSGWLKGVRTARLSRIGAISGEPIQSAPEVPATSIAPISVSLPSDNTFQWTPSHGVGLQYSLLSGSGVTYRRWHENGWGYQVSGIPALSFSSGKASGFINLGMQGMLVHLQTNRMRLYSMFGIGAYYRPSETRYYTPEGTYGERTGEAWDIGIAPGLGLDYRLYDRFVLTGALGYTFSRQKFHIDPETYGYSPGVSLGLMLEW